MVESKELHWIECVVAVGQNTIDLVSDLRWKAEKGERATSETIPACQPCRRLFRQTYLTP